MPARVFIYMKRAVAGFISVASVILSGAIGLGGLGAVVSFYYSNEQFSHVEIPVPAGIFVTPTPSFMPVIMTPVEHQGMARMDSALEDE